MKKLLSILLALVLIGSVFCCFQTGFYKVDAAMASKNLLDGYENICLTYTFRTSRSDYGRHSAEDLLPYVAYLDKEGNMKDYFFDSYLFLPCVDYAPSGGNVHYIPGNPLIATDWEAYVNDTFYPGKNVDALDEAFGLAKETLGGDANKKAGVFFSILYPATESKAFGTLGGRSLNFSKVDDRKYAIKWIIDEQISRYNKAGYENLDLVGFYWLEEYVNVTNPYYPASFSADYQLFKYASDYLHSLGYKFIWIPYHKAAGYAEWSSLGFDFASLQPNYFWSGTDTSRIATTCSLASRYGMGMEMEVDGNAAQPEYYKRYLKYLETGMNNGAMNSIKTYYQDGKTAAFYSACYSQNPIYRNVYDLTYKYAKGTLKQSDINYNVTLEDTLPYSAHWVSLDCTYSGCASFTDGNSLPYQDVSGKELTDGVIGESELGTEWHAYHYLTVDEERRMSSVIDLGKVRDDLTHFVAHFNNCRTSGIGLPNSIRFYYSENGTDFTLLNSPPIVEKHGVAYSYYISDEPIKARYVKLSVTNTPGNPFVFCSEFLVGAGEVSDVVGGENGYIPPENDDTITPPIDDDSSGDNNSNNENTGDGNTNPNPNPDPDPDPNPDQDQQPDPDPNPDIKPPVDNSIVGDVNLNGKIDGRDYLMLKRFYFKTLEFSEDQITNSDINKDGKITARDYLLLKRMYFNTYIPR